MLLETAYDHVEEWTRGFYYEIDYGENVDDYGDFF